MKDLYNELMGVKDQELDEAIDSYKEYYCSYLRDLVKVMTERKYRCEDIPAIENELEIRKKLRGLVNGATISKKTVFKASPQFTSIFQTKLPEKVALKTSVHAMVAMGWYVVHVEDLMVEGKRPSNLGEPTEKVTITIEGSKLTVNSKSIQSNFCDFGKNSRRSGEFKIAFQELESQFDESEITHELELIKKQEKKEEYQIPETLTQPQAQPQKSMGILIGGAVLLSVLLGGVIALCASFIYIIILYDFLIGLITAIAFGYLIKLSKVSNFSIVRWIGFASIGLSFFLSQVFRFMYIVNQNNIHDASIFDYFQAKLNQGIQFEDLNLGMIGLIIAWVVEIAIALIAYHSKVSHKVLSYDIERAPDDVMEFAIYLFNQGKEEDEVRKELYSKGWYKREQQDIIINAVGALSAMHQINRD